jgi:hypothetical protein
LDWLSRTRSGAIKWQLLRLADKIGQRQAFSHWMPKHWHQVRGFVNWILLNSVKIAIWAQFPAQACIVRLILSL